VHPHTPLAGQPLLSIADVQWVLHSAKVPSELNAQVLRSRKKLNLTLTLDSGWRRHSDVSWRATTWDLRRMALGGLVLKSLPPDKRGETSLGESQLALAVGYVGEYGAHAAAKKAGFKKDDIIVSVDEQSAAMTEGELLAYLLQKKMIGARVPMTVLREGQRLEFELPMQ